MMPEIITCKALKNGKHRVTVDIRPGQKLLAVDERVFYRLGGQLDEIVPGHVLTGTGEVYWCHIGQDWRDA